MAVSSKSSLEDELSRIRSQHLSTVAETEVCVTLCLASGLKFGFVVSVGDERSVI